MATIAAGNHKQIYFDHLDDIVITPGSGGTVKFDCSTPNSAATRPTHRTIYSETTISIPAGSTVFLDAVGADATYTTDDGTISYATNSTTGLDELDESSAIALSNSGIATGINTSRFLREEYGAAVLSGTTITDGGASTVGSSLFQANNAAYRWSNGLTAPCTLTAQVGTAYTGRNRNDSTGVAITQGTQWAVEFDYYGQVLEPYLYGAAGCVYWIWASDPSTNQMKPTTAAPTAFSPTGNSYYFKHIDFGSAAKRRIRIEGFGVNAAFNGVRSGNTVFVTPPDESRPDVLAWIGDSYPDGRKATSEPMGFLRQLGRMIGMEAWQFSSYGGQGLIYTDKTPAAKHIDRITTDYAPIPNVRATVLQGSINDYNGTWSGTVGPAAVALVAAAKAAQPDCKYWAFVSPLAVLSLSTYQTMSNQIRDALAESYPEIPYIDMITTPWISGNGKVGSTTGNGVTDIAADADGVHPTQTGHNMLAVALASRLRAAWHLNV